MEASTNESKTYIRMCCQNCKRPHEKIQRRSPIIAIIELLRALRAHINEIITQRDISRNILEAENESDDDSIPELVSTSEDET